MRPLSQLSISLQLFKRAVSPIKSGIRFSLILISIDYSPHKAFLLCKAIPRNMIHDPKIYSYSTKNRKRRRSSRSSTDSDLDAFSHNPTDDSFAPLSAQAGPNTNYPNERFLSY